MSIGLKRGFTLIELSIVLVIIGLIVGGVLVGQNLIAASSARAQITQVEKLRTAANTFFGKYSYLPGDIPATPAAQFGFVARGPYAGEGDGNGLIEGITSNAPASNNGLKEGVGETGLFWVDLSASNLISGGFSTASATGFPVHPVYITPNNYNITLFNYFPTAIIGYNFIYVWSYNATNFLAIAAPFELDTIAGLYAAPGLTVGQAYSIDKKMDDGMPQSGNVIAAFATYSEAQWADGATNGLTPETSGTSGSPSTCYDNGGNAGAMQYSITQNNGSGINCVLSFYLKSGD